jgi:hypothetical protein
MNVKMNNPFNKKNVQKMAKFDVIYFLIFKI